MVMTSNCFGGNKDNLRWRKLIWRWNLSVTIPTRSLREIEKLISSRTSENSIKLFYDKGQLVFISSNQIITTRTLEGSYPNYPQLIPDSFSKIFTFNTKTLIEALERIAVLADQQSSVVKIKLEEKNLALIMKSYF